MPDCAYCEHILTCDACGADYQPASLDEYQGLSAADQPIACPSCGATLVCHWCKTPYDGKGPDEDDDPS